MTFKKWLLISLLSLIFITTSAFADICYDRRYGYYTCYPYYSSYPYQGQYFMESVILGIYFGSSLNDNRYNYRDHHWNRGHEHWDRHTHHHHR